MACNQQPLVTSNQTTKDIARSLFKETVQKSAGCFSDKTSEQTSTNPNDVSERDELVEKDDSVCASKLVGSVTIPSASSVAFNVLPDFSKNECGEI